MGILGFLESKKAKNLIRKHAMTTYDLMYSDLDVVMESTAMQNQLYLFGKTSGPHIHLKIQTQIAMLLVADSFMEELLNRANFEKISADDRAKLKFCIGVMVDVTLDGWFYDGNKLLRLDLWQNYWKMIDKEGARFIKKDFPFIPVVFSMIVENHKNGVVVLDSNYPIEKVNTEIQLAYS
jgi:hypothetical protein